MNPTLRIKLIAAISALLVGTLLAVLASVLWQGHSQARTAGDARITQALRLLGELYATRRTQAMLQAEQLAADKKLIATLLSVKPREVTAVLAARLEARNGGFTAVLSDAGELLGLAGDAAAPARNILTNLLTDAPVSRGLRIFSVAGEAYVAGVAPVRDGRHVIVNALAVNPGLAQRVRDLTGVALTVRQSSAPFGSAFGQDQIRAASGARTSVALDESFGVGLVADLILPSSLLWADLFALAKQTLLVALAALLLALFIGIVAVQRLVRRQLEEPLHELREGFRRAMAGDYSQAVSTTATATYAPMLRAFNDMQTRIAEREGRIVHHAQYDALTGLTNRSVVNEKIQIAVAKAQRRGSAVAAIALDLSRFNEVNDSLGHDVGDQVLKEVARRLASNTSVSDTVSRVGGDEFLVVLEDADEKLTGHLAEFLVSSLEEVIRIDGSDIRLHVHAGLALYPTHCDAHDALRRMANIALLTAKEKGLRVVNYEPGQDEKQLRELAIIHDLPNAIRCNELYLQYQPKIDVDNKKVEYVEALVRWRHPQLGFIPPDEFITLLEKSGRIGQLTDWVMKEAVKQCRTWADEGYTLGVAVNISANDLSDSSLPGRLNLLMRHYLVDARQVVIEVTESAVIKDPERSIDVLNEFRKHGHKIALDDFGTGQTSLALLKKMPLSEIKIDKSFVQNLRADSGDAIIVKSIIDLGHNMGLLVTAEGVESNYCWNLLNSYGCDVVQGYLVSAPLTADELREWYLRLQERHVHQLDYSFVRDASA